MIKKNSTISFLLPLIILVVSLMNVVSADETIQDEQSLYKRLGGLMPISVVVSDFLDALVPDTVLNANPAISAARERVPAPYLKYHVTAQVCEAAGGPCKYHGRGMREAHAHLNITEKEWDRMIVIFKRILEKHDVPPLETQDLLGIINSTKADIVIARSQEFDDPAFIAGR